MNKDFKRILSSHNKKSKNFINEAPSAASSLLGGKTISIPRDGAHKGQSGWQSSEAWDIKANIGDPVYALADGKVITLKDYGPSVIKTQGKKLFGAGFTVQGMGGAPDIYYTHLMNLQISKGDTIKCGQLLGFVMDFPGSSYDHVHIGVKPPSHIKDLIDSDGKIKCASGKRFNNLKDIKLSDIEKGLEDSGFDISDKTKSQISKGIEGLDLSKLGLGGDIFKNLPFLAAIVGMSDMKESKEIDIEIKNIINIFENMEESASSIRQTAIGKYGWKEKSGQLEGGGEIKSDTAKIVNELVSEFSEKRPDCKGTFTSGNDKFHQNIKSYTSRHTKGEAIDLVLPSSCHSDFMKLMDTYKTKYNGFNYIDEYRNPTSKSTGGHFHLSYRPGHPEGGKKSEDFVKPEVKGSELENLFKNKDLKGIEDILSKKGSEKIDLSKDTGLDLFKGLPIFDILSKLVSVKESKKISEENKKIQKLFEQIEINTDSLIEESLLDDLGPNLKQDGKSIRIKIDRKTNIYSPTTGEVKSSFTNSSCANKVVIRFTKDNSKYYLEYCGLENALVSEGDYVSKSKVIGTADSDVTVTLFDKTLRKISLSDFSKEEKEPKKEKKSKGQEDYDDEDLKKKNQRYYDPLMATVRGLPFTLLGKMKSPTEKETNPPKGLYQYLDKNSPTKQKKVNENIERIKKLLK